MTFEELQECAKLYCNERNSYLLGTFFSFPHSRRGKQKNLWRRNCLRRAISPFQPLLCLRHVQLCHCATCQGSSYTKNEYSLFYQKFEAEYFFIRQFFRKSYIFRENRKKLFWKRIWQFFRERRRLMPKINLTFLSQMRYWIFYLPIFSKMCNFLRKREKTVSGAQISFEGKEAFGDENEYNLFYEKWGLEYFIV